MCPRNGIFETGDDAPKNANVSHQERRNQKATIRKPAKGGLNWRVSANCRIARMRGGGRSHVRTGLGMRSSLRSGKSAGIFAESGHCRRFSSPVVEQIQRLGAEFPKQLNREFSRADQPIRGFNQRIDFQNFSVGRPPTNGVIVKWLSITRGAVELAIRKVIYFNRPVARRARRPSGAICARSSANSDPRVRRRVNHRPAARPRVRR
jgi:hypothetical protein